LQKAALSSTRLAQLACGTGSTRPHFRNLIAALIGTGIIMNNSTPTDATQSAARSAQRTCTPLQPSAVTLKSLARALSRAGCLALPLVLGSGAMAADLAMPGHDHGASGGLHESASSPLVSKVRTATRRYLDINVALGEGWVQATPCVSGPNEGAMGVHFLKPDRLHDGALKADEPEMLIYEPQRGGGFRLVGVEYIVLASEWASRNPPGTAPSVDGHLAHFIGEPNRYALPAFYEMHVWAWEDNPNGSFSDWNSRVSCAKQLVTN
jgi:hypothetical protein